VTRCRSRTIDGTIFVPPIATFKYNGTEPANNEWPVTTYRWLGDIGKVAQAFDYHTTANTAEVRGTGGGGASCASLVVHHPLPPSRPPQEPVGFFDYTRAIKVSPPARRQGGRDWCSR
jgi:hypothetical protein